jgi:hypothetical protein
MSQLRSSAEVLSGLGSFLDNYLGGCGDTPAEIECRSRATSFRKKVNGNRFYVSLGDDAASNILAIRERGGSNSYTIQITPFFESGGYALTHGAPKKTDGNGNPQLPLLFATGKVPDGWDVSRLQRLLATRQVRLELVFVPHDLWTLPKRGGGRMQGIKANVEMIQITNVRTGDVLGVWPA